MKIETSLSIDELRNMALQHGLAAVQVQKLRFSAFKDGTSVSVDLVGLDAVYAGRFLTGLVASGQARHAR